MVIWLRNPQIEGTQAGHGLGIAGDVLPREDFATLVDIDAGYGEMRRQCDEALQASRAQAQAIIDEAEARAAALVVRAQDEYASAEHRGYDDGLTRALTGWHERAFLAHEDAQTVEQRRLERLAEIVALAVESIVADQDPVTLFKRAAAAVERIVADGSPVHVCVHPIDLEAANTAFNEVALGWREAGRSVRLQLRVDAALDPGACVCETDLGTVDMSLSLQLAAMRGALARAVQSVPGEDFAGFDGAFDENDVGLAGESEHAEPASRGEPDAEAIYAGESDTGGPGTIAA